MGHTRANRNPERRTRVEDGLQREMMTVAIIQKSGHRMTHKELRQLPYEEIQRLFVGFKPRNYEQASNRVVKSMSETTPSVR